MRTFVLLLSSLALFSSALLAADEKPAPSLQDRLKAAALDSKTFTLVVEFTVKPESIAKMEKLMLTAYTETNKEPGCKLYDVHRNPEQPGKYVFLERFDGLKGLEAHLATQYTKDLLAGFGTESSEPPKIMLLNQMK
jgi:quinol monooxygenase YgiN